MNQSTISREWARHCGKRGYWHKQAQAKADKRRREAVALIKMTTEMVGLIDEKIREDWSPEQVSGWLLEAQETLISHETIYRHLWADKQAGGELYTHGRRQGKQYAQRRNGQSTRGPIKHRVSIDDRPEMVDDQARVGDGEIDTMIGTGHSGALVTVVERSTNGTVAAPVTSNCAADVTKATIALLTPFMPLVHTITADHGKEFSYMIKSLTPWRLRCIVLTRIAHGSVG